MTRNLFSYCLLALVLSPVSSYADSDPLAAVPLKQCTLQETNNNLSYQSMKRTVTLDNKQRALESEYNGITAKLDATSTSAVKAQLTPAESARLEVLKNNSHIVLGEKIVESQYLRDQDFIMKLVQTAKSSYLQKITLDEKNPDFTLMTLMIWRLKLKMDDNDNVPTVCNRDYALYELEPEHVDKFAALEKELNSQPSTGSAKTKKAIKANKARINKLLSIEATYLLDIENIRRFARISTLVYQSDLKDVADSNGNLDVAGNTIKQLVTDNKVSADDQLMVKFWQYVNEKVPSKMMLDIQNQNTDKKP